MLKLANGVVIDPDTRAPIPETVPPSTAADAIAHEIAPPSPRRMAKERNNLSYRTRLHDMSAEPRQVTATAVVLSMFMFGLPDQDIAEATGFSMEQVQLLRTTDLFDELHSRMVNNVRRSELDRVRQMLEEQAETAAIYVTDMVSNVKEKSDLRLKAAQDVLDRSGHRPADVHEHRHRFEDEMRIRVVKDVSADKVPYLDLTPEPA